MTSAVAIIIGIWQHGWLYNGPDAMNYKFGNCGGLGWLTIPMGFAIMFGLALDYEIFLLGRIIESRKEGRDTRGAVVDGGKQQLKTIMVAGLIMIISFSGLLISRMPMLNQVGFFLAIGTAIDVFFVRCFVVPGFTSLIGDANWWPGHVPPKSIIMPYEDEYKKLPQAQ